MTIPSLTFLTCTNNNKKAVKFTKSSVIICLPFPFQYVPLCFTYVPYHLLKYLKFLFLHKGKQSDKNTKFTLHLLTEDHNLDTQKLII